MKNFLMLLSSDAENLSLVRTYLELTARGAGVDICFAGQNQQAVAPFMKHLRGNSSVFTEVTPALLSGYPVVICGRTCFEALSLRDVLSYRGIILADDTCMYDGRSVYGDVVCVNGASNLSNIFPQLEFPVAVTGCVKADHAGTTDYQAEKYHAFFSKAYDTHVLYVESGHFPFGTAGRRALADSFCTAVQQHKDTAFLVKPRFLPGQGSQGRHRNADHLYGYINAFFGGKLPDNLKLLETAEDMGALLTWADVGIYTYSSAHIEAVRLNKPFFQLAEIPSLEIADFRRNRMSRLESFMDHAGCTIHHQMLADRLVDPPYADSHYQSLLDGGRGTAVEDFATVAILLASRMRHQEPNWLIDQFSTHLEGLNILRKERLTRLDNHEALRRQRIMGYIACRGCRVENRLDDYMLVSSWLTELSEAEFPDSDDSSLCQWVEAWLDRKIQHALAYTKNGTPRRLWENPFDRAFALRYYYESGKNAERDHLLDRISEYTDHACASTDTAWLYYSALRAEQAGATETMQVYFSRYLSIAQERGFALNDAEGLAEIQYASARLNF